MTKKHILRPLAGTAAAALLGFSLAACSGVYTGGDADGSTVSLTANEAAVTESRNADGTPSKAASFSFENGSQDGVGSCTIDKAASDSTVTVKIYSYTRLDAESVAAAFSFYALSENNIGTAASPTYAYPKRTTQLSSSVLDYGESFSSYSATSTGTTTVIFKVDTSAVENNRIALFVDATKLKDARGNFVLNNDENETAGEETDNQVQYITIGAKADGNAPTVLVFNYTENFAWPFSPSLTLNEPTSTNIGSTWQYVTDTNGKATGAYRLAIDGKDSAATTVAKASNASAAAVYNTTLADKLNAIYSIEYKAPTSSDWVTDTAFKFAYDSTEKLSDGSSNPTYRYYVATTSAYEYGTQFRLVTKTPAKGDAANVADTTNAPKLYGHDAYFSYRKEAYTSYSDPVTSTVLTKSSYIVSQSSAFSAAKYDVDDFEEAQTALFADDYGTDGTPYISDGDSEEVATGVFQLTLGKYNAYDEDASAYKAPVQLKFGSTAGFSVYAVNATREYVSGTGYVTTTNYTKLDSTTTAIGDHTVLVSLANKAYLGRVALFVGGDTALASNPLNTSETQFGYPATGDGSPTDGLVQLYTTVLNVGVSDD